MDEEKQKDLEAKGWKVGDVDELLGIAKLNPGIRVGSIVKCTRCGGVLYANFNDVEPEQILPALTATAATWRDHGQSSHTCNPRPPEDQPADEISYQHWVDDPACHDALCSYKAESGVPEASNEYQKLLADFYDLKNAITEIVTETGDDLCWMDIYNKLAGLVGIEFKPDMLPREQMLANCERFVDSLLSKTTYVPIYGKDAK